MQKRLVALIAGGLPAAFGPGRIDVRGRAGSGADAERHARPDHGADPPRRNRPRRKRPRKRSANTSRLHDEDTRPTTARRRRRRHAPRADARSRPTSSRRRTPYDADERADGGYQRGADERADNGYQRGADERADDGYQRGADERADDGYQRGADDRDGDAHADAWRGGIAVPGPRRDAHPDPGSGRNYARAGRRRPGVVLGWRTKALWQAGGAAAFDGGDHLHRLRRAVHAHRRGGAARAGGGHRP